MIVPLHYDLNPELSNESASCKFPNYVQNLCTEKINTFNDIFHIFHIDAREMLFFLEILTFLEVGQQDPNFYWP